MRTGYLVERGSSALDTGQALRVDPFPIAGDEAGHDPPIYEYAYESKRARSWPTPDSQEDHKYYQGYRQARKSRKLPVLLQPP
jgi:hypothetical protein